MLEGLEISEVTYSRVYEESYSARWDSNYFSKEFLDNPFENHETISLKDVCYIKSGSTPINRDEELKSGVVLLKTSDIRNNILYDKKDEFFYIDQKTNEAMKGTQLKPFDVLINIVGATTDVIGRTSLVTKNFPNANITQAMSFLRKKSSAKINQFYLFYFLLSKYGNRQVRRNARPTGQYNMNHSEIGSFELPILQQDFQDLLKKMAQFSEHYQDSSLLLYRNAESFLLSEIGLHDFQRSSEKTNIKNFSKSFLASGRIDAEFYQPKYEQYEQAVKVYEKGYTTIGEEFRHIKGNSKKDRKEYKYIEIGDVNVGDGSNAYTVRESTELPANAKYEVKAGDLLISKVRPNRGAVTIIADNAPDIIVSGAFTVLREKKGSVFSNEMLKVLCRTPVYKDWMLKYNVGSQYPVIKDEDILNLPIPKLSEAIQKQISEKVKESQQSKFLSDALLNIGKRAVEIAIEKDEQAAEIYIRDECSKLGVSLKED